MDKKMIATRDGLGDELVELGKKNKSIYVVDADIGKSCKTTTFAKTLPEYGRTKCRYCRAERSRCGSWSCYLW